MPFLIQFAELPSAGCSRVLGARRCSAVGVSLLNHSEDLRNELQCGNDQEMFQEHAVG